MALDNPWRGRLCLLQELSELLSHRGVTTTSLSRCKLERERIESLVIATHVTSDQR
jgi:hypothetical protein